MKADKGLGPTKRFGVRYGRTTKYKLAKIEKEQKKPQPCPYCDRLKAKRVFAGVYECRKCNAKFTSRAYFVKKKAPTIIAKEKAPVLEEEQKEEAEA